MGSPKIYFHVGLGKVASTYLQQAVFPKLEGIHYIHTSRYRKSKDIIPRLNDDSILVSREFDRQFEDQVRWFTSTYPEARIIIILRRHDSWIASQYRRHVKNGFQGSFQEFFDVENDDGYWKKKDLMFYPKLEVIEECCENKPLVLFYSDLKKDPWAFIDKIADYTGSQYSKDEISLDAVHKSYSEKQLKVLRAFCRRFLSKPPTSYKNKVAHWLLYRPWWAFFHLIMYVAAVFPDSWVPDDDLIESGQLDKIRTAYEPDWKKVKDYTMDPELVSKGYNEPVADIN